MAQRTILTDDFLRYLMAVGQVDVLVGLPTFNNASTAAEVVKAIHVSFARDFPRHRTVLVNLDGGSTDGTPEIVRNASPDQTDTFSGASSLRTIHRISSPYHGLHGKVNALRALFAAADLTQARAVAMLDPDVTSVKPDWVKKLVEPALHQGYDFVAPVYARPRFDGPLVTQLLRPLMRATYRRPLLEPVGGEFAVSRAFAVHASASPVWDTTFTQWGMDLWLPCEAFATGRRVAQVCLGPRTLTGGPSRPALADVMQQVVGSLFTCLALHEEHWMQLETSEDVPVLGTLSPVEEPGPPPEPAPIAESLGAAVLDLEPVLARVLRSHTHAGLRALAERGTRPEAFTDDLWGHIVAEFAAAHASEKLARDHLFMALVPLYLGHLDAFVAVHRNDPPGVVAQHLAALSDTFERLRPYWVECWNA
jgi:glucosylglycerate synthase